MKKSYIERAMRMAETLSSYMESYSETMSIYNKCNMAAKEYNIRHKHSFMGFENGSTRLAFIISDYVLKVDYRTIKSYGNSETELKAWDFICKNGMEEYFAEITKYTSKSGITLCRELSILESMTKNGLMIFFMKLILQHMISFKIIFVIFMKVTSESKVGIPQ